MSVIGQSTSPARDRPCGRLRGDAATAWTATYAIVTARSSNSLPPADTTVEAAVCVVVGLVARPSRSAEFPNATQPQPVGPQRSSHFCLPRYSSHPTGLRGPTPAPRTGTSPTPAG